MFPYMITVHNLILSQISDGYSALSGSLLSLSGSSESAQQTGNIVASSFQSFVVFIRKRDDSVSSMEIQYRAEGT